MFLPNNSTNLKNRVNKLPLPKTKSLLPLFEVISNGIHAIMEKEQFEPNLKGKILIEAIRNGREETLASLEEIERYPINSFKVSDNGIGLNEENIISFAEFDSERKAEIGGKGVGRLVCLKAFNKLIYESVYFEDNQYKLRKFDYKKTKEGFDNYHGGIQTTITKTGTVVILSNYEYIYQNYVPYNIMDIARQVVTHFQLYYIQKIEPEIILRNQNNTEINLTNLFNREFKDEILTSSFEISNQDFKIFISKSYKAKSHKIHYCAHERSVKEEGLSQYIEDLRLKIHEEDSDEGYFFQVFIVGDFLDKNVNESRTSFNFSLEDDEFDAEEITLAKIRKKTILSIEELLSDFLKKARKEKLDTYYPIIEQEYPNYHSVINYNKEKVERLPIGLSSAELDIKLYEIENHWRLEVKKEGIEILDKKKDITSLAEYKKLYNKFLTEFNDIGQSDLARYVVHRRSVIDLLEKLIDANQDNKFVNEDIVHSLFYPIRESRDTVLTDNQNLWLLDERLTFNSLLASDKLFKHIDNLGSDSADRMDIIIKQQDIFENATLFSEDKYPFESFTIVEFKKPYRNDYQYGVEDKDPIRQVRKYIREILDGKIKKNGRKIEASERTPFYCYIIADITETLKYIIQEEGFTPMPDSLGFFRFYDSNSYQYKAYIEILPFKKIIKNAKERNKALFDKLKLS